MKKLCHSIFVTLMALLCLNPALANNDVYIKVSASYNLTLPVSSGVNHVLTAKVKGDDQKVWLANNPEGQNGIAMAKTDVEEYQINLADENVIEMLFSSKDAQFYVVAENSDGKRFASIPIRYTRKSPEFYVELSGSTYPLYEKSYDPSNVRLFKVQYAVSAMVLIGDKKLPFVKAGPYLQFELDDSFRKAWQDSGELTLSVDGTKQLLVKSKSQPEVSEPEVKLPQVFTLRQRDSRLIPGINENLSISAGDISGGRVNISIYDRYRGKTIKEDVMTRYDALELAVNTKPLRLVMVDLFNSIGSSDYATFLLVDATLTESQKVDVLVAMLVELDDLVVGTKKYRNKKISMYLADTFGVKAGHSLTVDELITNISTFESQNTIAHTVGKKTLTQWLEDYQSEIFD